MLQKFTTERSVVESTSFVRINFKPSMKKVNLRNSFWEFIIRSLNQRKKQEQLIDRTRICKNINSSLRFVSSLLIFIFLKLVSGESTILQCLIFFFVSTGFFLSVALKIVFFSNNIDSKIEKPVSFDLKREHYVSRKRLINRKIFVLLDREKTQNTAHI